jgi:hypothetical protein
MNSRLRIAAGPEVERASGAGFGRFRLRHRALPVRDLARASLETSSPAGGCARRS